MFGALGMEKKDAGLVHISTLYTCVDTMFFTGVHSVMFSSIQRKNKTIQCVQARAVKLREGKEGRVSKTCIFWDWD